MRPITSSGIPRTTSVTSRLPSKLWNFHVPLSYICLLLASITTVAVAADTSKDFDGGEEVGQRETLIINFYPEKLSLFQFKSEDIAISFQVNSTQGEAQDQVLENGESDVEKPAWLQCPGELNIAADSAVHLRAINGTFNVTPDDFRNEENFTITLRANNLGYAYLIITWTSLVPLEQCQQALQSAALNFKSLSPAQPKLIATQNGTGLTDYMTKAQNTLEVLNEDSINEEISEDDDGGDDDDEEGEEEEHTTTTPKTTLKKSKKKSKKPKKTVESLDYSSYLKRSEQMSQTQVNQISLVTYDFSKNGTEYRYQVIIYRDTGAVDMLFVILVTVCVAVNTLFMGCQIDLKVIIQVLKKPIGPAVGYVSQFVFMPVASYILSQLLFTEPNYMLGLFALGCSPGGSGSNFWTLLLGGDLNLSVTMTFISTVCCIFMMPLWLFTLGQSILRRGKVSIPFSNLVLSLIAFTAPLGVGLLIQRFRPKWAKFATKLIKPFTFFIIIAFNGLAIWNNMYVFRMMTWQMVVGGMGIAWGGYAFGAIAAWLFRQGKPQIIAISIETAIQNPGVTFTILRLTLPQPDADMSTVAPVAQIFITNLPLFLIFLLYKLIFLIKNRCCKTKAGKEDVELENLQPLVGDRIADQKNRDSRPPALTALDPSLKNKGERHSEPRYVTVPMYSEMKDNHDVDKQYDHKKLYPVELLDDNSSIGTPPTQRYKDPVYQNLQN